MKQKTMVHFWTILIINLVLFIFSAKDVLADSSNPQVVMQTKGDIRELPKTGLPLIAWAFSSLLPAGFGLKRFGKKDSTEESANSIWMERELGR